MASSKKFWLLPNELRLTCFLFFLNMQVIVSFWINYNYLRYMKKDYKKIMLLLLNSFFFYWKRLEILFGLLKISKVKFVHLIANKFYPNNWMDDCSIELLCWLHHNSRIRKPKLNVYWIKILAKRLLYYPEFKIIDNIHEWQNY